MIDTISEAAVQLLESKGAENYSPQGVGAVVDAVEAANADADFTSLSVDDAVTQARTTAANDAAVQQALAENRLPTPTATPGVCIGDCNGNSEVTVDELIKGANIALGNSTLDACPQFDVNGDGSVTINEIITAVNNALRGCQG